MSELEDAFETEVTSWESIQVVAHRFGGTEFQWNNVEIGHIHRGGMTDIPFTRRIREALVEAQIAHIHHTLPESGWITFQIHTPQDVDTAQTLMRLSYIHKRRRVSQAAFLTELETLALPDTVKKAALGQASKGDEE